jgi:nucleoid DNA-binding protein
MHVWTGALAFIQGLHVHILNRLSTMSLISGFGKFRVKEKAERKGRNPVTGEDMMLAPRKVVTFKCSGKLCERVDES